MKFIIILGIILSANTFAQNDPANSTENLEKNVDQSLNEMQAPFDTSVLDEEYLKSLQGMDAYQMMDKLIKDGKVAELIKSNQEHMAQIDDAELEDNMRKSLEGHPFAKILDLHPKGYQLVITMFKDPDVASGLAEVSSDKKRLYIAIGLSLSVIILIFVFSSTKKKNVGFFKRSIKKLSVMIAFSIVHMVGMFFIYLPLTLPSAKVVQRVFLS